jgi:Tol biopolymer transport system component
MISSRRPLHFLAPLIFFITFGCGDDTGPGPAKVPRLTTPRIAMTSNRNGTGGIQLYDPSSGQITRLSPANAYDQDPAISPDGTRIAFVSTTSGGKVLMTMAVDGSDRKVCGTNLLLTPSSVQWSPDSRRIGFTGESSSGARDVWIIDATGDSLRNLTSDGVSTALAWSPDGARVLYMRPDASTPGSNLLREVQPDSGGVRTLLGPLGIMILGADYSADGLHVAFCYDRGSPTGFVIEVCNPNGSNRVRVAESNPPLEELGPPSWSPDGTLIVFSAHIGTASNDLYTATPTPADPQLLLGGAPIDQEPNWGPRP